MLGKGLRHAGVSWTHSTTMHTEYSVLYVVIMCLTSWEEAGGRGTGTAQRETSLAGWSVVEQRVAGRNRGPVWTTPHPCWVCRRRLGGAGEPAAFST